MRSRTRSRRTRRPSLIRVHSHIGYGSPHRQDTSEAHGKPLGADEIKLVKKFYGWPLEPDFYVPDAARAEFLQCVKRGADYEADWQRRFDTYAKANPAKAADFKAMIAGELPAGWDKDLPVFTPKDALATRESASRAEAAIAPHVWNLFGGAADLNESTFTNVKDGGDFERGNYAGRNLHFGIREHGMCAILNGIALARRLHPVRVELLRLYRLLPAVDPAGGVDGTARGVCLHARFDWSRRGRPDASADRARSAVCARCRT